MLTKELLTQKRLKELLHYDPETGVFLRLVDSPRRSAKAGDTAGGNNDRVRFSIENRLYSAGHVAFLYMTGEWPTACLDPIDGDHGNNRWGNLRQATRAELMRRNVHGIFAVQEYA